MQTGAGGAGGAGNVGSSRMIQAHNIVYFISITIASVPFQIVRPRSLRLGTPD